MPPDPRLKPTAGFRSYRRNLPHWEDPGSVYFLTFHTFDEIILSASAKDIVSSSLHFHSAKKYRLYAFVIMDTHVHSILQPLEVTQGVYHGLSQITHSLKSYTSNRIQRELNVRGKIWQDESFDRIIRDEHEYLETAQYIIGNAQKAGYVAETAKHKWLYIEGFE